MSGETKEWEGECDYHQQSDNNFAPSSLTDCRISPFSSLCMKSDGSSSEYPVDMKSRSCGSPGICCCSNSNLCSYSFSSRYIIKSTLQEVFRWALESIELENQFTFHGMNFSVSSPFKIWGEGSHMQKLWKKKFFSAESTVAPSARASYDISHSCAYQSS